MLLLLSVTALPTGMPPLLNNCTVLPATGSAPVDGKLTRTVRLLSLVVAPFARTPVPGAASSVIDTMPGAERPLNGLNTWALTLVPLASPSVPLASVQLTTKPPLDHAAIGGTVWAPPVWLPT